MELPASRRARRTALAMCSGAAATVHARSFEGATLQKRRIWFEVLGFIEEDDGAIY